jgi:hypothetical protein
MVYRKKVTVTTTPTEIIPPPSEVMTLRDCLHQNVLLDCLHTNAKLLEILRAASVLEGCLYVRSEDVARYIVLKSRKGLTTVKQELDVISSELCALSNEVEEESISIKEAVSYFHVALNMKREKSPSAVDEFVDSIIVSSDTPVSC